MNRTEPADVPRLVVVLVVDQMRADYLERFRSQFEGGFDRLLQDGAVFVNAHHEHVGTDTAVGHAVLLSGRHPSSTGIIGNKWVDRATPELVWAVGDPEYHQLGGGPGESPRRFQGTTLCDWLLDEYPGARVVSVSAKDRAAILMAGHRAQEVYWYSTAQGQFTTSTYYRDRLPEWVEQFNRRSNARFHAGKEWTLLLGEDGAYETSRIDDVPYEMDPFGFGRVFPHEIPSEPPASFEALRYTPFVDELTLDLALEGVEALRLGQDETPDLLLVSLSATDYIGHAFGPMSRELHDQILRLDRLLGQFMTRVPQLLGHERVLFVLTADHGVVPIPAYSVARGDRAGWVDLRPTLARLDRELDERFGQRDWILALLKGALYLDRQAIREAGGMPSDVADRAAQLIEGVDGIARAVTRDDLMQEAEAKDAIGRRLRNAYHRERGADVLILVEPLHLQFSRMYLEPGATIATNHGTPYDYDTHVPLIFIGPRIRSGPHSRHVATVDLAPTLAAFLEVAPTESIDGTVLHEVVALRLQP